MLYPFSCSIQQYIECVEGKGEWERCRPARCPVCRSKKTLVAHGFYSRTVVDKDLEGSIRVRRYLCGECGRTVSLLPEFVLPYMRFTIEVIGSFLQARLSQGLTLRAAAGKADQGKMPYQRGQDWVRRFRRQAESVSAGLAGLVQPIVAADFASKALGMLEKTGWVGAHRFLFEQLRTHLLGWPGFLAPAGIAVRIGRAIQVEEVKPHNTCMDSESPPA